MDDRKIDERTFDFGLLVVDVYRFLLGKKEFVLEMGDVGSFVSL